MHEFWLSVRKTDAGCWEWEGSRNRQGYGECKGKPAHRVAWAITNGEIPAGMLVCHRCDNPPCCNPAHLFLGTPADNQADAARKGRKDQKLSRGAVAEIRALAARGIPHKNIAQMYGISPKTVWKIAAGVARPHVVASAPDLPPAAAPRQESAARPRVRAVPALLR